MLQWLLRRLGDLPWSRVLPQGGSPRIEPREAMRAIEAGEAVLVDVREHGELMGGLAEPAVWMPTSQFSRNTRVWRRFVDTLPREKRVIVYCAAGVRAGRVADALARLGFDTANLGAYRNWHAAGLPTRMPDVDLRERLGRDLPETDATGGTAR